MNNYLDQYRSAKQDGYSDEEIISYLEENDPDFSSKMKSAIDDGYSPEEILSFFNSPSKKEETESTDYVSDFATQGAQGFGIGALGTYGDILDLLGLQSKEISMGEKEKYSQEHELLGRLQRGEDTSLTERMALSDDDILPYITRLPTSQDVEKLGAKAGLVTEPKTAAGRYGKRIGKIAGSSVGLGSNAIKAPIYAGLAGQTLEELGAPPWMQATAEIIATLKAAPKSNIPITSKSKEVQQVIDDLRAAGYSEKDITLAKSALEERGLLKKYATLTPEAENSIQQGLKNSEELFKEQIKKGLPGYAQGGLPYLEKQASNVYKAMEDLSSNVKIPNKAPVKKAVNDAIAYLEKYPLLDEQKKFIEFMKDGLTKLDKADTAEFLTGFYRNLGKAGNWGNPSQKEHLLGLVKQGIKDTFEQSGPEAARFGKYFEATNESWKKWLNARDLMQNIEKAQTTDGMNFKKLSSILSDPDNHELAKKVLGSDQLKNIQSINKGATAIESLLKQIPKTDKTVQYVKILEGVRSLLSGNYKPMAAIITLDATKRLSTSLLFDPEKQNIMKKLIVAAQNNAPQQAAILAQELIKEDSSQAKTSEEQLQRSQK